MFLFNTLSNIAILFLNRMKYVFLWNVLFLPFLTAEEVKR